MKIIDKINGQNDLYYSFEYYPPKTLTGQQNLYFKLEKMASYEPLFIDLTYFITSRNIAILAKPIIKKKILNLVDKSIFKNNIRTNDKKIVIGNNGCSPFKPELVLIKFTKSIPKQDLCNKKPNKLLSLW